MIATASFGGVATPRAQAASAGNSDPSAFEWFVVVFGLIVQQGAFISVPFMLSGDTLRATVNPFNTIAVTANLALLALVVLPHIRAMASLAMHNLASMSFVALVLLSTIWSLHPDLTMKRGVGYVLTIALACYVAVRFGVERAMRALSISFVISAVGSILCAVLFPSIGIMHNGELAGTWRGVFPHKNVFGPTIAAATFVELYLIVRNHIAPTVARQRWRYLLLVVYVALIALSHSSTALLLFCFYSAAAASFLLWRRYRLVAAIITVNVVLVIAIAVLALWSNPELALTALGKDATLTGRTTLWEVVVTFIREKPVLGWGYHAMWVLDDATTELADRLTGHWGVTSSHNAFLEITLHLGLVGLGVMVLILLVSMGRALRCARVGDGQLGWFSMAYFLGAIMSAQTVETLGRNQAIEWFMFNVFSFGCGVLLVVSNWNAHTHSRAELYEDAVRVSGERPVPAFPMFGRPSAGPRS